ncbi:MAG TPA: hypothetical protein VNO75_12020 [Gemmatimonadaceae bacterium]|nr:hypothetical protein [Gemmatimonadaceae bacterium]
MTDTLTTKLGTDVRSGIKTDALLDTNPPGFLVTWIEWDSDFRRNLRVGDLIVGVNGASLAQFLQPGKMGKGVGQYAEKQYWDDIGAKHEDVITLSVLRQGEPVAVEGRLGVECFYYDAQGKRALAPGGPQGMANDGFGEAWSGWLERFLAKLSLHATHGWTARSFTNRVELAWYMEQKPRIDHLLAMYPGPFSETLRGDWTRGMELAQGKKADLGPAELEYRALGARRVEIAKAEAAKAWPAMQRELAHETIPAFPAASVLEREKAVGKVVDLPAITFRNFLNDLGRSFAAIGSPSDSYYFILLQQKGFANLYEVLSRYRGQVNPGVEERYRFIARILDDPQMFTVSGRPVMGLTVDPLGAMVGQDEMFADLRTTPARFAGEEALSSFSSIERDDTSPARVIEAMIQAVKTGDDKTWISLFANWNVMSGRGGRMMIDYAYNADTGRFMSYWERSRRLIMGDVYDARVDSVEKVQRVLERDADHGLPNVDQVVVWVDHYGLFDGEYRTFQNINVHRRWVLQRLDGGPWKITSIQSL